jgi:hypothetical protein
MINARTYVRLLRHLGIALIFAPEPFTTPFGVAFILVARHLSRRREAIVNNRLRKTVQYYLAHTSSFSDYVDGESGAPASAKCHSPGKERAILGQITGSRSLEAGLDASVGQNWYGMRRHAVHFAKDMPNLSQRYKAPDSLWIESGWSDISRRTEEVIHHTINMEWLSRRFESANSAVAHSGWATTCGAEERITHHSINMSLCSQHYETANVGWTRRKYHTINMAQLRQRYGSAASYTRVLNALQGNNYYYEILSRGNVIGGY